MQRVRKCTADVVVVGAGVAGCSAFYHLARLNRHNPSFTPILLDALPPLSLTSANGSFSYRNWFPSEAEAPMRALVTASIDQLDDVAQQTGNAIELNRNGYLFVTRHADKMQELISLAQQLERQGGGKARVHDESSSLMDYQFPRPPEQIDYSLDGTDLLVGIANIKRAFPSLKDSNAIAALHVRRCGSMSPSKLAAYELTKAVEYCPHAQVMRGKMTDVFALGGKISGIKVEADGGESHHISTPKIVLATGPLFEETMGMLKKRELTNFDVPIINELHMRAVMDDPAGIISPSTPLTFDCDPVGFFEFTKEERENLRQDPSAARLLKEFPPGVHVRPYLESKLMSVWTFDTENMPVTYPIEDVLNYHYPEACLRALCRLYPHMKPYLASDQVRQSMKVNGGYYCKTLDNMPLIGPAPDTVEGVYLQSAMSGVGLMSSGASGHLLAAHVMGEQPKHEKLVEHMGAFLPSRFEDSAYVKSLADGNSRLGQI